MRNEALLQPIDSWQNWIAPFSRSRAHRSSSLPIYTVQGFIAFHDFLTYSFTLKRMEGFRSWRWLMPSDGPAIGVGECRRRWLI